MKRMLRKQMIDRRVQRLYNTYRTEHTAGGAEMLR